MSWTYEQISGHLLDKWWKLVSTGYSGHGQFKNDPSAEGLRAEGPIPAGSYKATALELKTAKHGPYVIVLTPDDATRAKILALGRTPDEFRMHGDGIEHPGEASEGCIIMPRPIREAFWASPDHDLDVVAQLNVNDDTGDVKVV